MGEKTRQQFRQAFLEETERLFPSVINLYLSKVNPGDKQQAENLLRNREKNQSLLQKSYKDSGRCSWPSSSRRPAGGFCFVTLLAGQFLDKFGLKFVHKCKNYIIRCNLRPISFNLTAMSVRPSLLIPRVFYYHIPHRQVPDGNARRHVTAKYGYRPLLWQSNGCCQLPAD